MLPLLRPFGKFYTGKYSLEARISWETNTQRANNVSF